MSWDRPRRSEEPQIDLDTVRETIAMMHDDMKRSTRLQRVHEALGKALAEIATIEAETAKSVPKPTSGSVVAFPAFRPQFKPWTPGA